MKISIDTDLVKELSKESDQILISQKGERVLLKLIEIEEQIKEAIKEAKENIKTSALKLNKNFTSVQGDKIKVAFRAYGMRYGIDQSYADKLPKRLIKKVVRLNPDTQAIDDYLDEHGKLPLGVLTPKREKQIVISKK